MKNLLLKVLAGAVYVSMVVVNFMANSLPINNRSTGQISDDYPNLFVPAGLTFSIWGIIYLLLGGYVVYQFTKQAKKQDELLVKINPLFILTSLANISWIFAWHYDYVGISVIIMATLLLLLIRVANILTTERFTGFKKLFIWAPFSVYFGWTTVATIANVTVFLVSVGWNRFGILDYVWTSIILLVGTIIGILRMNKDKNFAYGLVIIWAYLGILLKHLSASGFNGQFPSVVVTVIVCLTLLILFEKKLIYSK